MISTFSVVLGVMGPMCSGDKGYLYTVGYKANKINYMTCNQTQFIHTLFPLQPLHPEFEKIQAEEICYNSNSDEVILLSSSHHEQRICAVKHQYTQIWNVVPQVGKMNIFSNGLVHHTEQDVILTGDKYNHRIVVLSASSGATLDTLDPHTKVSRIENVHLIRKNRITVRCVFEDKVTVIHYKVKIGSLLTICHRLVGGGGWWVVEDGPGALTSAQAPYSRSGW